MKRQKSGRVGLVLLAVFGGLLGLIILGKLMPLLLVAGAVYAFWKLFLSGDGDRRAPRRAATTPPVQVLPPLDLEVPQADDERARLDRELEKAIQAANARQAPEPLTG